MPTSVRSSAATRWSHLSNWPNVLTEPSVEPESESMTSSNASKEAVYPDTDSLLKIAERVHAARTSVTNTAENMLGSADHVCVCISKAGVFLFVGLHQKKINNKN